MKRTWATLAALLVIGSACTSNVATKDPALPSPSPSSPSPSPVSAGWPPLGPFPPQAGTLAITGTVRHANGTPAAGYCVILTAGPCNVTTDANGYFGTYFLPGFPVTLVIKGWPTSPGGDGDVVASSTVNAGQTGIAITVP